MAFSVTRQAEAWRSRKTARSWERQAPAWRVTENGQTQRAGTSPVPTT